MKIIEETIAKNDITLLYTLEYKELYVLFLNIRKGIRNPIVYSRNGKALFSSINKSEGSYTFMPKDLQRVLEAGIKKINPRAAWRWKFMNPKEEIPSYYTPYSKDDETLVFESRFESGNLDLAIKISDNEYNLVLQNDSLSNGHTQWLDRKSVV